MAKAFNINIESLREKSRELLLKIEKNSIIVSEEIKNLHSEIRLPQAEKKNKCVISRPEGPKDYWKIRNDSSGVSGLLCPNLFEKDSQIFSSRLGDNCDEKDSNMTIGGGKILLTSKPQIIHSPLRRPVQGCYCNEPRKIQPRSARTIHHKPLSTACKHCQSNYELNYDKQHTENTLLTPALSYETLQRVQRINYTPRSQFLRKVQQKLSNNHSYHQDVVNGDDNHHHHVELTSTDRNNNFDNESPSSPTNKYRHNLIKHQENKQNFRHVENNYNSTSDRSKKSSSDDNEIQEIIVTADVHKSDDSPSEDEITRLQLNLENKLKNPQKKSSIINKKNSSNKSLAVIEKTRESSPEIETILPPKKINKNKPKKTISSVSLKNKNELSKNNENNDNNKNKTTRLLTQKNCCYDNCLINEKNKKYKRKKKTLNCCHHNDSDLSKYLLPDKPDDEAIELRKFRDKNYFDTHGSKATLLSSSSGSSFEQFELNERLFPENIGRISRDDLVVSMPICTTKQLKKIHYFPRNIVQQEKNNQHFASKKYNHANCPLIGHAIDIGVLKTQRPKNSLALKFQDGVF
ncbi:hypothetical protein HCN44_003616 [Aphidius gifuensis]|uniref:Uncharacterized protein n=1 Tax=Aphidius gifuensis TaxID=684658 RepID=A0A835CN42_APHGI|nr:probable WRKY transcription factor protein 1 [Aphidius gifuensis]KAF7987753.1 hypothetical protein HCN44_003616 [Aphidius gifuensis]